MTINSLANEKLENLKDEIILAVQQSKSNSNRPDTSGDLSNKLSDLADVGATVMKEQKILDGLRFQTMRMRESNIVDAHTKTFEWIFDDLQATSRPQINFKRWLLSGNGIYWVAGKAGSGKSTLMKYLVFNESTRNALRSWAGKDNLVVASFFFWNAGTPMQKSQLGLLQSLLHKILGQCSSWIPTVCPSRWQKLEFSSNDTEPWTRAELLETLDRLTKQDLLDVKFCFFIDGLDEYEGDHPDLIRTLENLAALPSVKMCVSSRPWNEFVDAFGEVSDQKLVLQDLTRDDIRLYVQSTLRENSHFSRLAKNDPHCDELVKEIVNLAHGVFLWVILVVRSLLRGLKNADDISDLQDRLRRLPPDLEAYFQHMFDNIDDFYHEQTARIFQLTVEAIQPLSVTAVSYCEKEKKDPDYAFNLKTRPFSDAEIEGTYETIQTRLNARCRDLLEVNTDPNADLYFRYKVDFLHRTVRDFLKTPHMRRMLASWTDKDFDAKQSLCRALLAQIKSLPMKAQYLSKQGDLFELVYDFMHYSHEIEKAGGTLNIALIDALDDAVSTHTNSNKGPNWTNLADNGTSVIFDEHGRTTFLALAIEEPLLQYVANKLDAQPQSIREKRGRHLLDYALRPASFARISRSYRALEDVDPGIVRLLLDRGADPNKSIGVYGGSITVWTLFLQEMWLASRVYESDPTGRQASRDGLYAATELLIRHGANPDLRLVNVSKGLRATPTEILHHVFSQRDAAKLEALLVNNHASGLWKFLKWGTPEVDMSVKGG